VLTIVKGGEFLHNEYVKKGFVGLELMTLVALMIGLMSGVRLAGQNQDLRKFAKETADDLGGSVTKIKNVVTNIQTKPPAPTPVSS